MVFDDDMRASAKVLALHSFMDGGMQGPGADMGKGNSSSTSSSLYRMGALHKSLVSDVVGVVMTHPLRAPAHTLASVIQTGVLSPLLLMPGKYNTPHIPLQFFYADFLSEERGRGGVQYGV